MPSDRRTTPERPRPTTSSRPTQGGSRAGGPQPGRGGRPQRPEKRGSSLKNLGENIGWGLVIGLPVILVVLAILWRATNGFQGTSDTTANDVPTPVPTATAGTYVAPPPPAGTTPDRLVYLQAQDATSPLQLFTARQDGSDVLQITNSAGNKANPVWSPDGKQIAFQAENAGLELVNFDGSGLHTVAYDGYSPVWSPDGKQIAFLKNQPAPDGQGPDRTGSIRVLYVTKVDGKPGDEKQLASDALGPSWSPDGKQIAFFSLRNAVMFTVDVASASVKQIPAPDKIGGWYPTFAADNNSILFYGNPNAATMVASLDLAVTAGTPGDPTPAVTTPASTLAVAPTTPAPTGNGNPTATSAVQAPATPGITVGGTPAQPSPAAPLSPTAIPGPPSQISLYQMNLDGTGLKKLQDLEPVGGAGKFRFSYYVATSADVVSVLSTRPYYKMAPVLSPDKKSVATLYIGDNDKIGQAVVSLTGGPATLLVDGQNGLGAGIRLTPWFSQDGSKLYYSLIPPKKTGPAPTVAAGSPTAAPALIQPPKQGVYYDLSAKVEKPLLTKGDSSYVRCCGLK